MLCRICDNNVFSEVLKCNKNAGASLYFRVGGCMQRDAEKRSGFELERVVSQPSDSEE